MLTREEKNSLIRRLEEEFKTSSIVVCAEYRGLSASQMEELRKALKENGCRARVARNTLVKRSFEGVVQGKDAEESSIEAFVNMLEGPNFFVFAKDDPPKAAKALTAFRKENEALKIKGGWFEGRFIGDQEVEEIAKLPSKDELLAKLLSLINAPAVQLLNLLQAPAQRAALLLARYRDKLGER